MKIKSVVKLLIGIGILSLVVLNLEYRNLADIFANMTYEWLIPALLFYLLGLCAVSWRLKLIFSDLNVEFLFSKIFWANMLGMLLAEITPGKIGYLSVTAPLYKEKKTHKGKILTVIVATQVLDFLLRFSLAIVLILYFILSLQLPELQSVLRVALIFSLFIFVALIVFSRSKKIKYFIRLIPFKKDFFMAAIDDFQKVHKKTLEKDIIILTLASWIFTSARWIFIGKALSFSLSPVLYIFLQPVVISLSFLPITVGGLGVVETAVSAVFIALGIEAERAFAFAIMDRIVLYTVEIAGIKEIRNIL